MEGKAHRKAMDACFSARPWPVAWSDHLPSLSSFVLPQVLSEKGHTPALGNCSRATKYAAITWPGGFGCHRKPHILFFQKNLKKHEIWRFRRKRKHNLPYDEKAVKVSRILR
jgi:hypothetical protein